jgi:hypothetical protein
VSSLVLIFAIAPRQASHTSRKIGTRTEQDND